MTDDDLRETLAVVVSRIGGLSDDVGEMRRELREDRREYVTQSVWLQRNALVDQRFTSQGREIGDLRGQIQAKTAELRAEVNGRRAPWWSVAAVLVSALALGWAVVGPSLGG